MTMHTSLAEEGVCFLPQLLTREVTTLLDQYVRLRLANGTLSLEPRQNDAHSDYGDATVESLFEVVSENVDELVAGAKISYGYLRVYTRGRELLSHVDRESCDFTLSIALSRDPADSPWPLCVETRRGELVSYDMSPGDGVLLRGRELQHWREPLSAGWAAFAFLHWIDAGSPARAFDGRPGLGFPSPRRS